LPREPQEIPASWGFRLYGLRNQLTECYPIGKNQLINLTWQTANKAMQSRLGRFFGLGQATPLDEKKNAPKGLKTALQDEIH